MVNNKILTLFFSVALATGLGTSGCVSKDLHNYLTNIDKVAAFDLYQNSGNHDNLKEMIIASKIDEIIENLDLYESDDPSIQLDMCLKVQKYMTVNNHYDDTMINEKRGDSFKETCINDLYNVLVSNQGICTSNSLEFKEILSRVGIDVKSVFVVSNDNQSHMCNIVNIGGNYYYFDPTLERTIYDSGVYDQNNVVLFCAGMGKDNYEQYYRPIGVMDDNFGSDILPMPKNMSKTDIPFKLINASMIDELVKVKK